MTSVDFEGYVQYMFNLTIALAAAAAVFMIVFGGLQYMTTDSWQNKSAGLDKVRNAVYGLLLVLSSYLILRTIDPRLVAIPSTLVTPLNINYSGLTSTSNLFFTIASDANQYLSQDKQFMNDAAATQAKINDLESQRTDLDTEICGYVPGATCSAADISDFCKQNPTTSACVSLDRLNNTEGGLKGTLWTETAQHLMAGNLSVCFSSSGAQSDPAAQADVCHKMINDWASTYGGLSTGAGQSQSTQTINDYAAYANSIIDIQKAVLKYNPGAASTISVFENVGNLISFVSSPISSTISSVSSNAVGANNSTSWLLPNSLSTKGTVNSIQSIADNAGIKDPALKAQLISQAKLYEAGVSGGKK